jgi:hypothetical protein
MTVLEVFRKNKKVALDELADKQNRWFFKSQNRISEYQDFLGRIDTSMDEIINSITSLENELQVLETEYNQILSNIS